MEKWKIWGVQDARRYVAVPTARDDKYSRGVLGVIAGSNQYPGAAVLTTSAALQTGLGLLRYYGPRKVGAFVLSQNPEVVLGEGRVDAWIIGSGMASEKIKSGQRKRIKYALRSHVPISLDAGALSSVNKVESLALITPHYRELNALFTANGISVSLAEISDNPRLWAMRAATQFGVTVLLKGNVSVVASLENQIELPSATPWLATAGTGDVLAGIIGALMATNSQLIVNKEIDLASIAATASLIHAHSANLAICKGPITSSDVVRNISRAVFEIIN